MRNAILVLTVLLLSACGKSSLDEPVASTTFYGSKDATTEMTVSKISFQERKSGIGRYQVTQAVVQKSDGTILKINSFCGDFEALGAYFVSTSQYGNKSYSYATGFYESAYIAENQPTVAHFKSHPNAVYIDTALVNTASCL